jgi:hypothetical protein
VKQLVADAVKAWDRFFFSPVSPLPLGVFRFFFGANLLAMNLFRIPDWRFYFTDVGFVKAHEAQEILPEFYRPMITWFPTNDVLTLGFHVALIVAALCLMLGIWGRVAALVTLFFHLAFMQRNFSIVYGADLVSNFFLFGLLLSDNSRAFSVMSWLGKNRAPMSQLNSHLTSIGVRLVQIQLCVIYAYTGLEKLKGPSWWEGTAVWAVFGNQQIMMLDMSWLKSVPLVIPLMTFSTLIFEVYFPFLVWIQKTRKWTLAFGVMFHTMIALTVGLFMFSGAMLSAYFVFADPNWLRAKIARFLPDRWIGVEARPSSQLSSRV